MIYGVDMRTDRDYRIEICKNKTNHKNRIFCGIGVPDETGANIYCYECLDCGAYIWEYHKTPPDGLYD